MNSLEEQLKQLTILNRRCDDAHMKTGKVAALVNNLQQKAGAAQNASAFSKSRTAPTIPPKPFKKTVDMPQVPLSKLVTDAREPLFSQPLLSGSNLLLKQPIYASKSVDKIGNSRTTLDNPAILEQQLEALAYHKQQMEKKGLLGAQSLQIAEHTEIIPKLSSTSLSGHFSRQSASIYSNLQHSSERLTNESKSVFMQPNDSSSNVQNTFTPNDKELEEDLPPPPSPVSSSYSELRRASDVFDKAGDSHGKNPNEPMATSMSRVNLANPYATQNNYQNKTCGDYFGYGALSQSSSTYDSIYEPINPRPAVDISSRTANRNAYTTYVNQRIMSTSNWNKLGLEQSASGTNTPIYCNDEAKVEANIGFSKINENDEHLGQYHLSTIDSANEVESYGRCFKCNERVLGESSGCTAMDQIYHISCFTCTECQLNLQGKPFYALEGQPFCEYDYLQTLEKCSVCLKPILERILRATGKPYHPQCFTCVVCGNSLDEKNHFRKFAPRCCVCQEPIMPEPGQEETVRVVALDRSFHLECYKCEDCSLLLSSEADGRGCYPLDDHVLCKSCNARRVQVLTNRMTSDL
ncbi:PREDICTED: lipoma-preferred partner homolog [Drosophila arizonae]|uniref:Lipoma-preferred partner homolog n=1 Tax=Drosophila arizonae TaxID=7263 RepID=A0ABM1PP87_DROAR|nr:PREDICTED: lipoma-preferred partner homolog [Drosophila arizonae]